uniref:Uncharacterized protein n=1 Tax=Anguilla anguilla TaxID=7936 RepID=A0A0E9W0M8_ANGAN
MNHEAFHKNCIPCTTWGAASVCVHVTYTCTTTGLCSTHSKKQTTHLALPTCASLFPNKHLF